MSVEWHDRKKDSPKAPIDKNGYLCRCVFGTSDIPFYMVLSYFDTDKTPHFQHELSDLVVTHWAKINGPEKQEE